MRLSESESTAVGQPAVASAAPISPPPVRSIAPAPAAKRGPVHDAFDALADGYRRELLGMLCEGDKSVSELASTLPISRPAVSRHLKVLLEAGLVAERYTGTRHIFHLRPEGAQAVREYLERVWGRAAAADSEALMTEDAGQPGSEDEPGGS